MWNIHNEEELFEVWLYKINDKTFEEFKDMCKPVKPTSKKQITDIISESLAISNLEFNNS